MATLAQLRQRVSRKLKDPDNTSFSASVVNDEINRSISYYMNFRFWFNEALEQITLTSGSQVVPNIPSDVVNELQVNGLTIIDSQVKIDLIKLLPNDFVDRDQDQTGRPYYYTYRNNQFLLLPTPQQDYTLNFRYMKSYVDLVDDADTNDFTTNAPDLIMLHTLKNIYSEDKQDLNMSAKYSELERVELRAITERTNNRLASGYVQNHSILETYV